MGSMGRRDSIRARSGMACGRMWARKLRFRALVNGLLQPHGFRINALRNRRESRAGYQNLCQLITQFKMREKMKCEGTARLEDLQQYSDGLVCLTGGDEG